jgi:hypothetical protein
MALGHGASIVLDGLVLYLDAANPRSYPGTGTTWFDLSGRNNHGTMNSVDFTTNSMSFNNANDFVSVAHTTDFNFNSTMTVSSWILVNNFNTSTIYNILSKKPRFNDTKKGWSCQYDYRTTGILQFRNNDATVLNDGTPTANQNNTVLLNQTSFFVNSVWAISSTSVSFYINGLPRGTGTVAFTDTDTTEPIYIGKTSGSIGDSAILSNKTLISIYNRALTPQEIQQNFNALRGRYGI